MASIEISQSEILDALSAAFTNTAPQGAKTVDDLSKMFGIPQARVRIAIGRLAMQNRIEVYQVKRPDIGGRPVQRPAYVILPPKKKK